MNIHLNAVHAQSTLRVAQLLGIGCRAHEDRMVLEFPKRERRLEDRQLATAATSSFSESGPAPVPNGGLASVTSTAPQAAQSRPQIDSPLEGRVRRYPPRPSPTTQRKPRRPVAPLGFSRVHRISKALIPLHASMPLGASGQGRAYRVWASRSNGGRSWMATRCRELPGMQRAHGAASRGKEATAPFESAPAWTSHGRATAARKAGEGVRANCVASAELAIRSRKRQRADAIAERRANSGAVRSGAALGALMLSALESQGATHQFEVRIFGKGLDRKAQPLHELQHVGVVAQHQPINLREALVAGHIDDRLQQA
jgi:hypothetical protein